MQILHIDDYKNIDTLSLMISEYKITRYTVISVPLNIRRTKENMFMVKCHMPGRKIAALGMISISEHITFQTASAFEI